MNPLNHRLVVVADAIDWLKETKDPGGRSFLGSLPDYSEFPHKSLEEWKDWFQSTANLILSKTSPEGVSLFFQSDIKHEGLWIDKAFLIQLAARDLGQHLLFHKIFCRFPPGTITFGRPSYSHLLAFSQTIKPDLRYSTADVVGDVGEKTWPRGMGIKAAISACEFVLRQTSTKTLVNPFCGEGSVLAAANYVGLHALGIERSPKRAEAARKLKINDEGTNWVF